MESILEKSMPGARKVLTMCLNTQPGEKVAILSDQESPLVVAEALFYAALEIGAHPAVILGEGPKFAGDDPGCFSIDAIDSADVILCPTKKTYFHTTAVKRALSRGARCLVLSECDDRILFEGGINADFVELNEKVVQPLVPIWQNGKTIHMTTPGGTDLTASIDGRDVQIDNGLMHTPGAGAGVPDVELCISPVEGSANGTVVVDASCSTIGLISEPIRITVENGFATKIEGGREARELIARIEETNDPNSYNLAEMAIGLNPEARLCGIIIEDEGKYGTCHCALGNSTCLAGKRWAPIHLDMVQKCPTVEIDGKVIMKDGKLTF